MVSPVNSEHIPSDINFNLWGPVFLGHPVDTTIYTNDETFIKRQNMDSNAPDEKWKMILDLYKLRAKNFEWENIGG